MSTPAARSLAALADAVEGARHAVKVAAEAAERAALDLGDAPGSHERLFNATDYAAEVAELVADARDTLADAETRAHRAVRNLATAEAEGGNS